MPTFRVPDIETVRTKSELMAYFKAWCSLVGKLRDQLREDFGIIRGWCREQDRQNERWHGSAYQPQAVRATRPLWVASFAAWALRKYFVLSAQRVHDAYGQKRRIVQRATTRNLNWDD